MLSTVSTYCTGNENDLVFDTFKEQQQQYQALLDGSKVCWRGAKPETWCIASADCKENQGYPDCTSTHSCSIITSVSTHLQNIKAPLNGDDAAIRKYAQEMEALRKKVRPGSSPLVDKLQTNTRP